MSKKFQIWKIEIISIFVLVLYKGIEGRNFYNLVPPFVPIGLLTFRSGGFPKFPLPTYQSTYSHDSESLLQHIEAIASDESSQLFPPLKKKQQQQESCGLRPIPHNPNRNPLYNTLEGRIVGGNEVPYGSYPWQAELTLKGTYDKHICSGALVTRRHVVTAAHCLRGLDPKDVLVKVGKHQRFRWDEFEQVFGVRSWKIHPNFAQDVLYNSDIAVLRIGGKAVSFTAFVSSVCLPKVEDSSTERVDLCHISGWGLLSASNEWSSSPVLHAAMVPLLADSVCQRKYGPLFRRGMLCAGHALGLIDSCDGDSGGPLVCDRDGVYTLHGIVSWGKGCGLRHTPGVYTDVRFFKAWIRQAIQELN